MTTFNESVAEAATATDTLTTPPYYMRVTQVGVEAHVESYASAAGGFLRATQAGAEVHAEMYSGAAGGFLRATQVGVEVWRSVRNRAGVLIPGL